MRATLVVVAMAVLFRADLMAEEPVVKELTLHPRAIESPVLKYQLLPGETELKPGNAVPILLRLPWEQTPWMNEVFPKLSEWNDRPLSAPEWATSNGVIPSNFYDEMKRAAYRRDAFWEYPIGESQPMYLILLPDVQGMRGFLGQGLSARIRYHISRGELDRAREGILVGFANSRHLARTPFYVNQLVAVAIHQVMLERTGELISQPNSPNLYWAISMLSNSLVDFDRAASLEANAFAMSLPAVNDLDRPRDAKEWSKMAGQLIELLSQLGEIPKNVQPQAEGSVVEQLLRRLNPAEKSHLAMFIKTARAELPGLLKISEEKVKAMSDDEAGIRWYVALRIARDQSSAAILSLPPREARPRLKELNEENKRLHEKTGAREYDFFNPVSLYLAKWSLDRKIQSLRVIEAVRHHLATHDGKFPETLDAIQGISVPLDPLTDQPFQWKVERNVATLIAPVPGITNDPAELANRLEYRLLVK